MRLLEEVRGGLAGRQSSRGPGVWRRYGRAGVALAAAAALVLAVRLTQEQPPDPPTGRTTGADVSLPAPDPAAGRAADTARLGSIQPPVYSPPRLRAADTEARRVFRSAMQLYQAGRYADAIPGLTKAATLDPRSVEARFYLGVCYLMTNQDETAIAHLREAAAAGESPYLEDARFFLAKGLIRRGDVAAARRELQTVVGLGGERRNEAEQLLGEMRAP